MSQHGRIARSASAIGRSRNARKKTKGDAMMFYRVFPMDDDFIPQDFPTFSDAKAYLDDSLGCDGQIIQFKGDFHEKKACC